MPTFVGLVPGMPMELIRDWSRFASVFSAIATSGGSHGWDKAASPRDKADALLARLQPGGTR